MNYQAQKSPLKEKNSKQEVREGMVHEPKQPKSHPHYRLRRKTTAKFKQEVRELVGEEYIVLGDYQTAAEPVLMRHQSCQHEWYVRPANFLSGTRCPNCKSNRTKRADEFEAEVYQLTQNDYIVLEAYQNSMTHLSMQHRKCGHIWKVRPNSFLNGTRCPRCATKALKTPEQFEEKFHQHAQGEYELLTSYTGSNRFVLVKHLICGEEWEVMPFKFLNGTRCPKCLYQSRRKTRETFLNEVEQLTQGRYEVLGEYVNSPTPVLMRHRDCGHEWHVRPRNFLSGTRCPRCHREKWKKKA